MNLLNYIIWNPDVKAFGFLRWYSLCWLIGLLGAYFIVRQLYRRQGIKPELFDPLFVYCFVGILIGARLGHCLFYEPGYFLSSFRHVIEMLLPIHFMADGSWHFTGYEGLASHGGTIGLIIALWLENIVCMELLRRGYRVTVGKAGTQEIDFVCDRAKERIYVQVAYLLAAPRALWLCLGFTSRIFLFAASGLLKRCLASPVRVHDVPRACALIKRPALSQDHMREVAAGNIIWLCTV